MPLKYCLLLVQEFGSFPYSPRGQGTQLQAAQEVLRFEEQHALLLLIPPSSLDVYHVSLRNPLRNPCDVELLNSPSIDEKKSSTCISLFLSIN